MTDLQEILGSGDLEAAIADGIAAVKAKPTDAESRYRLFALMAFGGDLHRARKQLEALGLGDEQMERAKAAYINLLAAEQERRAVFHHGADQHLAGAVADGVDVDLGGVLEKAVDEHRPLG